MKHRMIFKDDLLVLIVVKNSSPDAYARILQKSLESPSKIVRLEREISVQFAHKIPLLACQLVEAVIECFDYSCAPLAETAVLAMHGPYPRILPRRVVDDAPGTIFRPIVHNNPLLRQDGLPNHALDGERQV